jgi:hypothetical protein
VVARALASRLQALCAWRVPLQAAYKPLCAWRVPLQAAYKPLCAWRVPLQAAYKPLCAWRVPLQATLWVAKFQIDSRSGSFDQSPKKPQYHLHVACGGMGNMWNTALEFKEESSGD